MRLLTFLLALFGVTLAFAGVRSAQADEQPVADPAVPPETSTENPEPGFLDRDTLTGD